MSEHEDLQDMLAESTDLTPEQRERVVHLLLKYVLAKYAPMSEAATASVEARLDEIRRFHEALGEIAVRGIGGRHVSHYLHHHMQDRLQDISAIAARQSEDADHRCPACGAVLYSHSSDCIYRTKKEADYNAADQCRACGSHISGPHDPHCPANPDNQ